MKIFVGYDAREDDAYRVCVQSILRHATGPVSVHPLKQDVLRELGLYTRSADVGAATAFSLTRFLTPYLAAADDYCVFVDCDFLFTRSVTDVLDRLEPNKAVHVVQHDYVPRQQMKMDGRTQSTYPRKNWSSFILFDGRHPKVKALTPSVVNTESPAYLHRFSWLEDDEIGKLDLTWNFLVGEYDAPSTPPASIHYTNGGPWFENCQDVDFADLWTNEYAMLRP
ncbi:glycosyltransferase [Acuticoccus sp. M5D2P5]|uniref:glycosyltransferase n=1 Tax=Acuticoccus kalidii TaxID=2910977 RepID=UPI001F25700E|nr:glycosyltransferase [Acuticoccus kalidii]MCF3932904.1 glycosyltransferase [Acuticoccus kalidii]